MRLSPIVFLCFTAISFAQTTKDVRATAKQGASALPQLGEYLKSPDTAVRLEAVKAIVDIGTAKSLDSLIMATRDVDESVQIRATDGMVNFYLPGYVPTGMTAKLERAGTVIKSRFSDKNNQIIDPFVVVRPDVIKAIGQFCRAGSSQDSRANAARALGILRGKAAIPDILDGLHSKDSDVLYETVIALQKIDDESTGPSIQYLLHDLNERVQLASIETTGILHNRAALPELRTILSTTKMGKVKHAALEAIAMLPDPQDRGIYSAFLTDKDESLRSAAAEGFGRLRNPADVPMLQNAYDTEKKRSVQISLAFALVMDGKTEINPDAPLEFLINQLNSAANHTEAQTLLTEAAHDPNIRESLYPPMETSIRDVKIGLAQIAAATGGHEAEPHLEKLSHDPDKQVAAEALRSLRNLRTRL